MAPTLVLSPIGPSQQPSPWSPFSSSIPTVSSPPHPKLEGPCEHLSQVTFLPCSESSLSSISFRSKVRVLPAANQCQHICPPHLSDLKFSSPRPQQPSPAILASFASLLFPLFSLYTCCPLSWGCHNLPYLHRVAFSSWLQCSLLERPSLTTQFTGLTLHMLSCTPPCSLPSDHRL